MGTGPDERPLTFWDAFQKVYRSHSDFPSDQEDMSDDQYPRYDTTMARLARDEREVFNHEDNREDHIRAEIFASFPVGGICKYPPPVSYREYSAFSKRLRRLIQNRAALVGTTNVALALIKAMKAYPMSSQKWREGGAPGLNILRPVRSHMGCVPVYPLTDETANEYAAVWVLKLNKKTTAALRALFDNYGALVEELANFAPARQSGPRLHYSVVVNLVNSWLDPETPMVRAL
ncbi:unnamed protein product, partial [Aphanomyces euteiches]